MNCGSWILKTASDSQFQDFDNAFDYTTGSKIGKVLFDEESAIASLSSLRLSPGRIFLTIDGSTVSHKISELLRSDATRPGATFGFGYLNRNYEEEVDIPLGLENQPPQCCLTR
jgi:hypothetical protein